LQCILNGKEVDSYSVYRQYNSTTKRPDVDHTVTCKYTTSAFPSYKHSLDGDTAANGVTHLTIDLLLIPRPTEGKRLSWPGCWPIADALPTKWSHVNHRSSAYQGKSASQRPTP